MDHLRAVDMVSTNYITGLLLRLSSAAYRPTKCRYVKKREKEGGGRGLGC
jgi:hypothetical protein